MYFIFSLLYEFRWGFQFEVTEAKQMGSTTKTLQNWLFVL